MPHEEGAPPHLVEALAQLISTHVDLDALLALAATAAVPEVPVGEVAGAAAAEEEAEEEAEEADGRQASAAADAAPALAPVRIAVAQDAAFCFYYHDNLELLRQAGSELVPFSPLADPLPADIAGVYLGGGYPERCAVVVCVAARYEPQLLIRRAACCAVA